MKRRTLLKQSVITSGASVLPARVWPQNRQRHNVILILTDDQGIGDFSFSGNTVLQTPFLDKLAATSVEFTDCHGAPISTPGRSQLLTGNHALKNRACAPGAGRTLIRRDMPTVAELFRHDGYITGHFGKWHLGEYYPDRPMDRGFDKALWFRGEGPASASEFDNDWQSPRYLDGTIEARSNQFCTDFWFSSALSWMDQQLDAKQPFFTLIAPNVPSDAQSPPAAFARMYSGNTDPQTARAYAILSNLDDNVGQLEEWLQQRSIWESTIVIYVSDNAASTTRPRANGALQGGKGSLYDGGHRVPCFIRFPAARFEPSLKIDTPVQLQDMLPTLLELCDVPPGNNTFDGESLAPLLIKGQIPDRKLVIQYGNHFPPLKNQAAIIWNTWRLVNMTALFDIERDPEQQHDVAAENQSVVAEMKTYYEQWWGEIAPDLNRPVYRLLGTGVEYSEYLTCSDWWNEDVSDAMAVSQAAGPAQGGVWQIQVMTAGTYQVELRRWPFHTELAIGSRGPRMTVSGRDILTSAKQINASVAALSFSGSVQKMPVNSQAAGVQFELTMPRGRAQLQGWFENESGQALCGAFYAKLIRLS